MNDKEGTKERLLAFISYLKIRKSEFERRCQLSNGYINSIKGDIGVQKLMNMINVFPQLNPYWVATGKGNMLKSVSDSLSLDDASHLDENLYNSSSTPVKDDKYQSLMKILIQIQKREDEHLASIMKLQEALKLKEDQINRLLNLVDKLNYNQSTPSVD